MKLVTYNPSLSEADANILIHTSVKLVTDLNEVYSWLISSILIHTSVKLVTTSVNV